MLENVDGETLKQIGLAIGTVLAGIVIGVMGRFARKTGDEDRPVTKADLRGFLESASGADRCAESIASFEKEVKVERATLYARLDGIKADMKLEHNEFEQRWLEYVRDQTRKWEDHETRIRNSEIALGPGGRRPR